MSAKRLIWIGLFIGSTAGGYVPTLFGANGFTLWSLLSSSVGAVVGIFAGHKLGQFWGLDG